MKIQLPLYSKLMFFNLSLVGMIVLFLTFKNVDLFKTVSLDREENYRMEQVNFQSKAVSSFFDNLINQMTSISEDLILSGNVPLSNNDVENLFYLKVVDENSQQVAELYDAGNLRVNLQPYIKSALETLIKKAQTLVSSNKVTIINGEKTPVGDTFVIIVPLKVRVENNEKLHFIYSLISKDSLQRTLENDPLRWSGLYDSQMQLLMVNNKNINDKKSLLAKIENEAASLSVNLPLQKYFDDETQSDSSSWLVTLKKTNHGISVFSIVSREALLSPAKYMQEMSIFFIGILVSCLVYVLYLFSKQFSKPIEILEEATKKISEGDLSLMVSSKINTRDEVKSLAIAFDEMVVGLKEREKMQNVLNKFHGTKVASELIKKEISLGGERKKVCILFSDIRGFTDFSEGHTSEEVVSMLNEYFEVMVSIINRHGGVVDKFIGDAIMAVWGIPHEDENDCKNALRACLDMRIELQKLNESRISRGLIPIKIGVGLHYGEAISGQIGSQERMEFTVIGDTVNTASRIEGATKGFGVDLLISNAVLAKLDETFLIQKAGNVEVQGKSEPLSLYQVDGIYIEGALKILRTPYSHFEAVKDKKSKII